MNGAPVWLASLSRPNLATRERLPTTRWTGAQMADGEHILRQTLDGIGDPTAQRLFRMQLTLCLHRRVSQEEQAHLPASFWEHPAIGLAGAPVAVLWETVPGSPSTRPCANPGHRMLSATDPELWLPVACGVCPSCRARAAIDEQEATP